MGKNKTDVKNYYCITVYTGLSFGNIVIDKHPVDWLHEQVEKVGISVSIVLINSVRINKHQYERGMRLAAINAKRMKEEQQKQIEAAHQKVTNDLAQQ
jgi:hypothetical protein